MMSHENRNIVLLILLIAFVGLFKVSQAGFAISDMAAHVTSFEECVAVGNPVMETSPRRCQSAGSTFVEFVRDSENEVVLTLQ